VTAAPVGQAEWAVPRERGWFGLVAAMAIAAGISSVAAWPPSLALPALGVQWLVPVPWFGTLVLVALAAAAVAAWARGGRWSPAVLSVVAVAVWLWRGTPPGPVGALATGWALLVAAAFGVGCLQESATPFLSRALPAVALAGLLGLVGVERTEGGVAGVARLHEQTVAMARDARLAAWSSRRSSPAWRAVVERVPAVGVLGDRVALGLAEAPSLTPLLPALLVLETLAALALAWALWHRLARVRLGPPLAALSEFRVADQLVWGLVAGATCVLLPSLSGWRVAGVNLMVVVGALFALRGLGVFLWWLPDRWAMIPLVVLLVSVSLLGPVLVLATLAALALGLGLGDTWWDFRGAPRAWPPAPHP
jgi:hypothetical protein